jgi:hypothetical protein
MKYSMFQNLPEEEPKDPKVGDLFLVGKMVEQKESKKEGESITMYVITKVSLQSYGNMIEYKPIYDILEY